MNSALVTIATLLLLSVPEPTVAETCSTFTTFNAALTPSVPDYYDRRGLIGGALKAENADVICLQEMWFEDDIRDVLNKVGSVYSHHFTGIHTGTNTLEAEGQWLARSACNFREMVSLVRLFPCASDNGCIAKLIGSVKEGLHCLADKCATVLQEDYIDPNCLTCLVMSFTSLGDFVDRCYRVFGDDNRLNPSGLVLLSKIPIIGPVYESYFPDNDQTLHRGLIQARIPGIGEVVCTHLTSVFPFYFEYDLDFSSYSEQKLHEINILTDRMGTSNHIMAGDLNTGPAVKDSNPEKNLTAEAPTSYELLSSKGYEMSTYLTDDGRCTYCVTQFNPLNPNSHNCFIDDVLVMGNAFSRVTKQRVLDQTDPPLSDHYGVRATLCKP